MYSKLIISELDSNVKNVKNCTFPSNLTKFKDSLLSDVLYFANCVILIFFKSLAVMCHDVISFLNNHFQVNFLLFLDIVRVLFIRVRKNQRVSGARKVR